MTSFVPILHVALLSLVLWFNACGTGVAEFIQDFESENSLPEGWKMKDESGVFEIKEGFNSSRAAQISGRNVELTYYAKNGIWSVQDGPGDFKISFFMQKGVSWKLVLAGMEGRGIVVYVEASKISVSVEGNNWWEARLQSYPIPDISGKWMTLRLTPLTPQKKSPEEHPIMQMQLVEAEKPDNIIVENLQVNATGSQGAAGFQRLTVIKIFEWSSGNKDQFLKLDNLSIAPGSP